MEDLHCSIQVGAHVATVAQMGNIAFRSGKKLAWDEAKQAFTDKAINKEYLMKEYHNG
ncbi:MAG: iolG 4 [Mucilaginibacter sp.]|nr:iolG 4 [Mucilaginibacter sp.]